MPSFTLSNFGGLPETVPSGAGHNVLDGVAMNAASDDRTVTVSFASKRPDGAFIVWQLDHNAATAVIITVEVTNNGGVTYDPIMSRAVSAGVGTNSDFSDSKAVTGDDKGTHEYELTGATGMRVVASATAGGASDLLDLQIGLV